MSPVVKRKREKFHIPSKILLLALTILCIGLIFLSLTTDLIATPLNFVAGSVVKPFQSGISKVGTFLSEKADELGSIKDLLAENQDLKAQISELTLENIELNQNRYELDELRGLYQLDERYEGYEKTGARIISSDDGNWFSTFIIDKGTKDGLALNMNVIADGGLVGRISSISETWARVTTIIADNSSVSGMILSTQDTLITTGSLSLMKEGVIAFSQLKDKDSKVAIGDKIITSNISDKYLPGILIGYVYEVSDDPNNLSRSGTLTPAVDFEHLDTVLVILDLKESVEE